MRFDSALLANTIGTARKRKRLSQRALAEALGVSHGMISELELGYRQRTKQPILHAPEPELLRRLATALEINPNELFLTCGYEDEGDPEYRELKQAWPVLSPASRAELISYMQFLVAKERKKKN